MNIILIEDELKTAKSLKTIITALRPNASFIGHYQSIEESVANLSTGLAPDVIFMDIQLSDGLCFEIFKAIEVKSPIIFCTAFDEYLLEAFKTNGVDYVLKPFSRESISEAFTKLDGLKDFFQRKSILNLENIITKMEGNSKKTSFLVFKNNKYTTVQTNNIAFFFIRNEMTSIMTFDKQQYSLNQSLDNLENTISQKDFFRVNRQYLVNFNAIKEIEHYFLRKLLIKLVIETSDKLTINKEKTNRFLEWMEKR